MRTAGSAAAYAAALLCVYLITGPLRATVLDAALGSAAGALIEAAAFMPAIVLGGIVVPAAFRITGHPAALLDCGLLALALFLLADAAVAVTLCNLTIAEHAARFTTAAGWIQAGALGVFAAFPWFWWRADEPRRAPLVTP